MYILKCKKRVLDPECRKIQGAQENKTIFIQMKTKS